MAQKTYIAFAEFDEGGQHYNPGDEFTPPANWQRDYHQEEIRRGEKNRPGLCFVFEKVIGRGRNEKTGASYDIKDTFSAVLPLEEVN